MFDTSFAKGIYEARYKHPQDLNWGGTSARVAGSVMRAIHGRGMSIDEHTDRIESLFTHRLAIPGGRYLSNSGRDFHQVNNCILLRCGDSREEWAELSYRAEMALMTGAGIGVWYGDVREEGAPIKRTGGTASGPLPKMCQINDTGRHVMQGGNRRSAIWAGLPWSHPDVFAFIECKDWPEEVKRLKAEAFARGETFPAQMDSTNISVTLDDRFFEAYGNPRDPQYDLAHRVYDTAVAHMLRYGEPGFTVDRGDAAGEVLRNACTEITSADDSDVCNLGSLVLSRFSTPEQFGAAVRDMTLFLTAGSVYSEVPYEKVAEVRDQNRRLGLGIIGLHEFLMKRGVKYGTDEAFEVLDPYMEEYGRALEHAHDWQDKLNVSHSLGASAIAPNGTIGIVAESTPSADPMMSAAEIRTVKEANARGDKLVQHVVVDPVARRLRDEGVDSSLIEDAHTLSLEPERRLRMQAYMQQHVDHSISSTVNLYAPITDAREVTEMSDTLMDYLPYLRGITMYPNGAIAGQPRTPCDLDWALEREGTIIETDEESCVGGVCGV